MKFKSILGVVLAGAMALGATAAHAQGGPIYLTPKLLYSHQKADSFNGTVTEKMNVNYSGADKTDNAFGGGVAIGYDFGAVGHSPFRTELEFLARGDAEYNYGQKHAGYLEGSPVNSNYTLTTKVYTVFANFYYDFFNDSNFTPYIGGGLGGAYIDTTLTSRHNSVMVEGGGVNGNGTHDCWNFAWNLGGGVAYQISETMALDFGYRYSDFGETDAGGRKHQYLEDAAGVQYPLRMKAKADLAAHEFILGLRISGY